MYKSMRKLSDDAIFNIISSDFESSDGQSRWDDIEETPEPTEAQILEESFEGKTDAELFALISNDCESSDGQSRYKNNDCKTVKKSTRKTNKPINKSNREKPMNDTMSTIKLASGKTIRIESNHAARLQKSIGDLSKDTLARVERARKRIERKDSFVASIKNPHARTYNQLSSWVGKTRDEKTAIHANDEDRIVYSI